MLFAASVGGRSVQVEVRHKAGRYTVVLEGRELEVDLQSAGAGFSSLLIGGRSHEVALARRGSTFDVVLRGRALSLELQDASRADGAAPRKLVGGPARVTAPMPGRIVRVLVAPGQEVGAGEGLVVMEAMKMENELRAPRAGRVRALEVSERQAVETGALLVVLE